MLAVAGKVEGRLAHLVASTKRTGPGRRPHLPALSDLLVAKARAPDDNDQLLQHDVVREQGAQVLGAWRWVPGFGGYHPASYPRLNEAIICGGRVRAAIRLLLSRSEGWARGDPPAAYYPPLHGGRALCRYQGTPRDRCRFYVVDTARLYPAEVPPHGG